ncbi:MAG: hypothetical protein IT238_11220 [Bacteroidia bacterium]|nr:hypothetical protein [Bacteroidia bacterium]MCZ2249487.1 hypothetical protein [Bacteroidia bacterium]
MAEIVKQLKVLEELQCCNVIYFSDGLFPVKRVWAKGLYSRNDNTAFFTACIGFTLIRYFDALNENEKEIVQGILERMRKSFYLFRNKDGEASYNFWETRFGKQFPGGYLAHHFMFFMIPDDIDDSSMIHLVLKHSEQERIELKEKMTRYAIGNLKWPDMPVKGYEKLKPYNTFFVKKMRSAFDVCALCNTLYFVYYYQLPLNEQDEDSLKVILRCIQEKDFINNPHSVSPYYPYTVLIIYHVARLMADLKIETLEPLRAELVQYCKEFIKSSRNKVERLILAICIAKLNHEIIIIEEPSAAEKDKYVFFVAGLLGEVSPKWLRLFSYHPKTHIKYRCRAYAEVLWLEYILLRKRYFVSSTKNS